MTKPVIRVLLIEDSQADVFLLEEVLSRDALNLFEIEVVERLSAGLEILNKNKFDLVLLDLGLPDSQGFETFKKLHTIYPNIPIVVLSGLMDDKLALQVVQAGAQDYLVNGSTSWEIAPRAIRYAIERQQSQTALRETNERLQALIQASPTGIVILDSQGYVRLWSPGNEHIFGWSEAETVGKALPYIPEDRQEEHIALRERVLKGEALTGIEVRRRRKDGTPVDLSISTAPLRDGQGNIIGILGLNTDITGRKQMEEALRDSEARYRLAIRATNDVIWEWNAKTKQLSWTENAQHVFGYSHAEVGPDIWWDEHIHPDDRQRVISRINAALQGSDTIWSEEYRFLRKDGSYAYISDHAYIERDGAGEATRMVGAMADVTERRQAEEALAEAHRRLSATLAAIPDLIFELDLQGRILDYHAPAMSTLYDQTEAFLGKTIEQALPPEAAGVIRQALAQAAREGGHKGASYALDMPAGLRWYELSIATKPEGSTHEARFLALTRDITARKQAEKLLIQSEKRYRTTLNNMMEGCQIIDFDWRYIYINDTAAQQGHSAAEKLLMHTIMESYPGIENTELFEVLRHCMEKRVSRRMENEFSFSDGTSGWFELSIQPIPEGLFILSIDITERKLAEEALRQSNELLSLFIQQSPIYAYIKEVTPSESRVLMASENFQDMIGIPGSLMAGRTMGELFPPEFAIKITADDWSVMSSGQVLKLDEDLEDRNYTTIKFPITRGGKNLLAGYTMDITERKQAEQALRASERRYRSLFEDSPISLWEEDYSEVKKRLEGLQQAGITDFRAYFKDHPQFVAECASLVKIVDVNKATVDLYQAKEKAELLTNLCAILDDDSYDGFAEELIHILEGDSQFGWEGANQTVTGERLDISLTWSVVPGYEHDLSRVIISITDITKRKQAEEALKKSEADYRLLFNNANDVILIFEPQNETILEANDRACKTYGFGHAELVGMSLKKLTKDVARGESQLHDLLKKGIHQDFETVHFNCRGEEIHFLVNSSMIEYQGRKAVLSINRDMTERKQTEEIIRQNEKKFKTLFEIAPVGISVLDREHNIIDTNYALQRITGLRKNELVNGAFRKRIFLRPDGSRMPPEEFASTRALQENMPIFDVETGIVTKDRGVVWTEVSAAPLDIPDASLVVITQDISERKQSEQTLRQRLAELETLYESGLSLSQLLEPKEIGQKIIDVLAEKLDWYHTTVRLYHPETDSLELLAYNIAGITTGQERQAMGERFKTLIARPGDGLSGWSLQHGETVRCGNVLKDSRYIETVPGLRSGLYVPLKTGERAIGVISVESEKPDYFTPEDEHLVATLAAQAAVALENVRLFEDLQKSNNDLFRAYDETILGWSHALDLRDKETEGHTQRVTTLTEDLARAMGISDTNIVHIRRGALLHDMGKMGVPDRILLKPDKLTEEEWIIMRQHPVHAYNLLSRIEFLRPALHIPHYHHERWDGSGYPDGLKGEQIPLEARIFAVIDVYDALISDRPYRPAWPNDRAIHYIREQAGGYFDPKVVEVFVNLINGK